MHHATAMLTACNGWYILHACLINEDEQQRVVALQHVLHLAEQLRHQLACVHVAGGHGVALQAHNTSKGNACTHAMNAHRVYVPLSLKYLLKRLCALISISMAVSYLASAAPHKRWAQGG